jgi:hypothetical protein
MSQHGWNCRKCVPSIQQPDVMTAYNLQNVRVARQEPFQETCKHVIEAEKHFPEDSIEPGERRYALRRLDHVPSIHLHGSEILH